MMKIFWGLALALAAVIALPAQACEYLVNGDSQPSEVHELCSTPTPVDQTITLGTVYSGNLPTGAGPWLTARLYAPSVDDTSADLTLTAGLGGADTVLGESGSNDLAGWSFYFGQAITSIAFVGGTPASSVLYGYDFSTGTVPGAFNLGFGWSAGSGFGPGDIATYDISFAAPFSAVAGDTIVANADGWLSAAYVQNIGGASCSAWIVAGNGRGADGSSPCMSTPPPQPNVPEPSGLGMFGLGALLLGGFVGLRRRMA